MNAARALAGIRRLGLPAVTTSDIAAVLKVSSNAANKTAERLAQAQHLQHIKRGLWAVGAVNPLQLHGYLSHPQPSYLSLQTALHIHGCIEQVPSLIYAVTLGNSKRFRTPFGVYSLHHIQPALFAGYVSHGDSTWIASPEKALFDIAYLSGTRLRRFAALPELELPRQFKIKALNRWLGLIPSQRMRTMTAKRLRTFLVQARST